MPSPSKRIAKPAAKSPKDKEEAAGKTGTQTLERGLDLLDMAVTDPSSVAELARRAGLSRPTGYRLVNALIASDFLAWSNEGKLLAGGRLVRLGALAQDQIDLVSIARPYLEALSDSTGLCAFLGRRDGDFSLHLFRNAGSERLSVNTLPGSRRLLSETGIGKALLLDDDDASWRRLFKLAAAHHPEPEWLPEMRRAAASGVVVQQGDPPDSINSVAAPIRDAGGRIVAAANVAAAAQYLGEDRLHDLGSAVRNAADQISKSLGWQAANAPVPAGAPD